jgi:hypothetical protein
MDTASAITIYTLLKGDILSFFLNLSILLFTFIFAACTPQQPKQKNSNQKVIQPKTVKIKKEKPAPKPKPKVVISPKEILPPPKPKEIECLIALKNSGAKFKLWQPKKLKKIRGSGTPCKVVKGVILYKGATGLDFQHAKINCVFALRLIKFEKILQEEAKKAFGVTVKTILNWGTYQCRNIGRYKDFPSEHSFANALDIQGFIFKSGKRTTVKRHFIKTNSSKKPTKLSKFWNSLGQRLYNEGVFSVVLTPNFDKVHYNHFHLDGARYMVNGT